MRRRSHWISYGLLAFSFPLHLAAQATEGSILGTVYDPSQTPVANAAVKVEGENTGLVRAVVTNEAGEYVVAALPLGSYSVRAEQPGFKAATASGIELTVKARVRVNLTLEIGQTTESVTVASSTTPLKADTIEVANLVTREQLQSLPVIGRHFLEPVDPNTERRERPPSRSSRRPPSRSRRRFVRTRNPGSRPEQLHHRRHFEQHGI